MSISLDAANALESAIDGKIRQAAAPRRRASGTVSRVDRDGTVYAVLESGIETVVEGLTASVNPGDTVNVTIEDGRAEVLGNYTDPSAGVKYVRAVEGIAQEAGATAHAAVDSAAAARQVADEANKVAQATNQHFFADTNGAHITDVTQDEWTAAVDDNFSDYDPTTKPYHNQLLNSLGILLRTALNNLVSITRSAIAFYDGQGNAAANIVARFGSAGAQIGKSGAAHSVIDANGQRFYGGSNGATQLANIGYGQGSGTGSGASTTPYYTFGTRYEAASAYDPSNVYTIGDLCLHDGNLYICTSRTVTGEWNDLYWVLATGNNSLVAGSLNCAARESSQAFGYRTKAVGSYALASGIDSIAWGAAAHAHNRGTWASTNQTAIGKYNEIDYGSIYALIIGNGTADNARSNALAVKWDGTVETAQDIPWTTLTLASGWTAYSTARTPMYRRVGSLVEVRGAVKPTAETSLGTSSVTFGTLPQGCRPVNMEVSAICQGSGVKVWMLTVDTDGNVCASRMRTMNSTAYQSAGTSEFMIFDVSFLAG